MNEHAERPMRPIAELNDLNRDFWTGGAVGELRIFRCQRCRTWIHPPNPMCRHCGGRDTRAEPASGRAVVFTYTVNHYPWVAGVPLPYVIALVDLDEQAGLRLNTNIVGCEPDDVYIGMPVRVTFEQQGDVFVPLFAPRADVQGGVGCSGS